MRRGRALALLVPACGFAGTGEDRGDDGDVAPTVFASCADALAHGHTTSGVYDLDPGDGGAPYAAYCDQVHGGGGWTLALKADGVRDTFRFDAPIWTDGSVLAPDRPGHDLEEAKLASFAVVPARELLIETLDGATRFQAFALEGDVPLADRVGLALPQAILPLLDRREAWERLVARALPACVTLDGINVGSAADHRARIGVVAADWDWDDDGCDDDWEAAIGIGLATGDDCDGGAPRSTTVGWNAGGCDDHPVFAYVFVR